MNLKNEEIKKLKKEIQKKYQEYATKELEDIEKHLEMEKENDNKEE